ncbi:MAG: TrbG/VirB9 family P-type conjugative transfer protein [Alphaproteobacteria bacterium]|nr:TrbG/VirB9 family P-type conjugative transfer protein [Alphaproteobacteria bacterium]
MSRFTLSLLILAGLCISTGKNANAQQSSAREAMDAAIEQSNGEYSEIDMPYLWSLGMQQKAWNKPMEHLGEGQTKPGYSRYFWTPDLVLPIRIREGMHTLINFPAWEYIENVFVGNENGFGVQKVASNALMVYASNAELVGMDTNMMVFGRSGNRYVFYLRSETFNTDRITNAVVDIVVNDNKYVPDDSGRTPFSEGAVGAGSIGGSGANGTGFGAQYGNNSKKKKNNSDDDWLKDIEVDPEKIKFDIDVFIPNPDDYDIAPERVWRDEIFTYIDFGTRALSMLQRPIVNIITDNSETPVGFRTRGPNGRLIVVEAIGDLVLRNGKKLVCLKIRKDPTFGLDWTEYEKSVQPKRDDPKFNINQAQGQSMMQNANMTPYPMNNMGGVAYPGMNMAQMNAMMQVQKQAGTKNAGSNFGARYRQTVQENIAVELAQDSNIATLEKKWEGLARKNKDLLSNYEPYYSLDTAAEGEARDLFRLRIGPVESIQAGDTLCNKLAKRGITCVVVRTQ